MTSMEKRHGSPKSAANVSSKRKSGKKNSNKSGLTTTAEAPADSPAQKSKYTLPPLQYDQKEEKLQIKYGITFFALKCVGSLARVFMLENYTRDGAQYQVNPGHRVMFEGIFLASSIST